VSCVRFASPTFGIAEQLSTPVLIDQIDHRKADFVLASPPLPFPCHVPR
jgi:hypothetical protein